MEEALLLLLILGWAAVLVPGAVRSRRSLDPHVTVGGFEEAMAVLRTRPDGREILVPSDANRIVGVRPAADGRPARPAPSARHTRVQSRRRVLFTRLVTTTIAMTLAAIIFGGMVTTLAVFGWVGTVGYVALLRHFKLEEDRARAVIRPLQERRDVHREIDLRDDRMAVGSGVGSSARWEL